MAFGAAADNCRAPPTVAERAEIDSLGTVPAVGSLFHFRPAMPTQGFQDQRMVRNFIRRPTYYPAPPVGKVEPRFSHCQQARLVSGVWTVFCKREAVGRESPILVTLAHGSKSPTTLFCAGILHCARSAANPDSVPLGGREFPGGTRKGKRN